MPSSTNCVRIGRKQYNSKTIKISEKQPHPLDRFFFPALIREDELPSPVILFRTDDVFAMVIFFVRS